MPPLTEAQIRGACERLLLSHRKPTTRQVMVWLRQHHGTSGRTERVNTILQEVLRQPVIEADAAAAAEISRLRTELSRAQARAARSEEIERQHQDFYARQYAQKLAELNAGESVARSAGVSSEDYLRLYQHTAELTRRLSRYEEVEPLEPPPG